MTFANHICNSQFANVLGNQIEVQIFTGHSFSYGICPSFMHMGLLYPLYDLQPWSVKINHVSAQKSLHFSTLLNHNSRVGYGNKMTFTSHMQKFMVNPLKLI